MKFMAEILSSPVTNVLVVGGEGGYLGILSNLNEDYIKYVSVLVRFLQCDNMLCLTVFALIFLQIIGGIDPTRAGTPPLNSFPV